MDIRADIEKAFNELKAHQNSLIGNSYQQALDLLKSWSTDLKNRFPKGEWRTINGAKVFVNEGKIVAGLGGFNKEIDKFFKEKKNADSHYLPNMTDNEKRQIKRLASENGIDLSKIVSIANKEKSMSGWRGSSFEHMVGAINLMNIRVDGSVSDAISESISDLIKKDGFSQKGRIMRRIADSKAKTFKYVMGILGKDDKMTEFIDKVEKLAKFEDNNKTNIPIASTADVYGPETALKYVDIYDKLSGENDRLTREYIAKFASTYEFNGFEQVKMLPKASLRKLNDRLKPIGATIPENVIEKYGAEDKPKDGSTPSKPSKKKK